MTNKQKKFYNGLLIKQVIHEEMKATPKMPYSEEETWIMIKERLKSEYPKKKGRFLKFSLISAAILMLFSFVQVQNGNAFGWLTKYVFKSQGTITNIESSNNVYEPGTNIPPIYPL